MIYVSFVCFICIIIILLALPRLNQYEYGEKREPSIEKTMDEEKRDSLEKEKINKANLFENLDYLIIEAPELYIVDDQSRLKVNVSLSEEGLDAYDFSKYTPYYHIQVMIRNAKGDYFYESDPILWDLDKSSEYQIELDDIEIREKDYVLKNLKVETQEQTSLEVSITTLNKDNNYYSSVCGLSIMVRESEE